MVMGTLRMRWPRMFRRPPIVLQTEVAECGLACLVMVARHHGYKIDLPTARDKFAVSPRGTTLLDLKRVAKSIGLIPRALRVEIQTMTQLVLPCVLHWNFDHFVVLTDVCDQYVYIQDPSAGRRRVSKSELSRRFTGVVLELQPDQTFAASSIKPKVSWTLLRESLRGTSSALIHLLALTILLQIFALIGPLQVQWMVDDVLNTGDRGWVLALGIGFTLLVLIKASVNALRAWLITTIGGAMNLCLFSSVLRHMAKLPMSWFLKRPLADVLSRLGSVDAVQRTLATDFIETFVDSATLVFSFGMMLHYSTWLSVIPSVAALLYGTLRVALYNPLRIAREETMVWSMRRAGHLMETVRGMQTVKLFSREQYRTDEATQLSIQEANSSLRSELLRIINHSAQILLFGLENVATISLSAIAVMPGQLGSTHFSVGMVFAFLAYKTQFIQLVGNVAEKLVEFRMLSVHVQRLSDITDAAPEAGISTSTSYAAPGPASWDIELRDIHFSFATEDTPVLNGVDLHITEGESVAIIGPSGSGKTTLIKIILGLLTPTKGHVRIGGKAFDECAPSDYRARIATVMQDDLPFSGTITQNISFFHPQPDLNLVKECARLACIHEDVEAMPMGYNTLVGDMGAFLSGGQRQRLMMARALYRQPRILLLDEATSHLDQESENLINSAVRNLRMTRVIVAHRPQTIASADRVIALVNGRLQTSLPYR